MIPRSKDDLMPWKDRDGNTFMVRPLTGRTEIAVFDAAKKLYADPIPFLESAEKQVSRKHKGRRFKAGEREKLVVATAQEMANRQRGSELDTSEIVAMYDVVDLLVVSYHYKDKDGKPATIEFNNDATEYFNSEKNIEIFAGIQGVNNLDGEEKKN